jgi:MFS family permease
MAGLCLRPLPGCCALSWRWASAGSPTRRSCRTWCQGLGLTSAQAGAIASANYAGYLVGALLLSFSGTFASPRRLLSASLLVSVATTGLMPLVPSAVFGQGFDWIGSGADAIWLGLVRFVSGVASALALILASTLVMDHLRALNRSDIAALHWSGVGVGIALSAVLVSIVGGLGATSSESWQAEWLACALVTLIMVPVIRRWIPARTPVKEGAQPARALSFSPAFGLIFSSYALFGFGYVITATFIVAIVRDTPQIAPLEPYVWLVVGLSLPPATLFWQAVSTHLGLYVTMGLVNLLLGLGVVASVLWTSAFGIFFAAICLGASITSVAAFSLEGARRITGADARQVFGIMTVGFGIGQCAGPYLAGVIADRMGDFVLASMMGAVAQAGAALLAVLVLVCRRSQNV